MTPAAWFWASYVAVVTLIAQGITLWDVYQLWHDRDEQTVSQYLWRLFVAHPWTGLLAAAVISGVAMLGVGMLLGHLYLAQRPT